MNVSLPRELRAYVQGKVASGKFASASEVVRAALRLMQERDARLGQETERQCADQEDNRET